VEERHVVSAVPNAADPITGGPINPGQQFGALTPRARPSARSNRRSTSATPLHLTPTSTRTGGSASNREVSTVKALKSLLIRPSTARRLKPTLRSTNQYGKEWSSAYEAGIKGRVGRLRYSLAGFYTQVRNAVLRILRWELRLAASHRTSIVWTSRASRRTSTGSP
jgi:iron complex outermembrane receptor protein